MTFNEFIDKVASYPSEWYRTEEGMIRTKTPKEPGWEFCPITWVCYCETGELYDVMQFKHAAQDLNLVPEARSTIINIADTRWSSEWPLARQLAKACGLKEDV